MDANIIDPSSRGGYKDFALSGKIMLSAIIILMFVVILIVCLHLYARWYVLRARRRGLVGRRRHRLIFYFDSENAPPHAASVVLQQRGLDSSVLNSLPVFSYSSKTHPDPIDCAVCLSEFEENEKGRILPKCSHNFHIDCIDMWFHSHSTCPLCRSPVDLVPASPAEGVISTGQPESEPGSSSGFCAECDCEDRMAGSHPSSSAGSASFRARRKPMELAGVSIEIPRRYDNFGRVEGEFPAVSPSTPLTPSFKSPISRVMSLSFKRIIGRDRRGGLSPSGHGVGCSSGAESDLERGKDNAL